MIHLQLQPEIEAQLAAEAEARAIFLDSYVEAIVTVRPIDPAEPLDDAQLSRDPTSMASSTQSTSRCVA